MAPLRKWRRFASDERGVAAVEMALFGTFVIGALLNVVEVGRYAYIATQVTSASQAGAHAAIAKCSTTETPVTSACPEAADAIDTAIAGTSLGEEIALDGDLEEAWYCVNAEGALEEVAEAEAPKPTNCEDAGVPSGLPALYLRVRVTHAYEALFPGLTITETLPTEIVRTAWMRML
jgi:Flp pilus assembly protein TadG